MKGFENFSVDERKMISAYLDIVPSIKVKVSPSGRKTYVIETWESDYTFRSKRAFLDAVRTTLREWENE